MHRQFKSRDWTIIFYLYFAIAMMLVAVAMFLALYVEQGRTMQAVFTVCNESRQTINGQLEQACGDAQDKTNSEFLCSDNNRNPDTHCWVELK